MRRVVMVPAHRKQVSFHLGTPFHFSFMDASMAAAIMASSSCWKSLEKEKVNLNL